MQPSSGCGRPLSPRLPADFCCSSLLGLVHKAEQLSLGTFHPAFTPVEYLEPMLQLLLPPDAHILASQRLGISLTRWPGGDNFIVTEFASRDEVIQVSCWWAPRGLGGAPSPTGTGLSGHFLGEIHLRSRGAGELEAPPSVYNGGDHVVQSRVAR